MWILHNIYCIVCHIFNDKYKHYLFIIFIYFHWYLKSDTNITNINSCTETAIY